MQYFKEVLNKIGISLQYSEQPNLYLKESSLIIRDLKKELEEHGNYPNNLPEFMNGLRYLIKKEKYFKKALLPSIDENDICNSKQQDCLFRVLLGVDCIQTDIVEVLLEEATTHAVENEDDTIWLRLILSPLRYIPYIRKPDKLNKQLLEILEVSTYAAQLEILSCIPEIIPDSEFQDTAKKLVEILDEKSELTAAIIDCLNFLGLNTQTKEEIQDKVLVSLNTINNSLKTFPMIFRFLVSDCKPTNLTNVLEKTRIAIDSVMYAKAKEKSERDSEYILAFQEIRKLTCKPNSRLADLWINLISSIRNATDHRPVDLIILFMLHSGDIARRRSVEAVIKKKSRLVQFRPELIKETFNTHLGPQIFNDYLTSILTIASSLLFHGSTEIGHVIFKSAFFHKNADHTSRRQILNSLILWPSGKAFSALKLLLELVRSEDGVKYLRPHVPQLMGLLDRLDTVELSEAAMIFELLCPLGEDGIRDDLHIIIRKQLHSFKRTDRYRGVVAAVAAAAHIANTNENSMDGNMSETSYESISDLPEGAPRQAAALLKLAADSTNDCPIAKGLYYDRLAHVIVSTENINNYFMSWLVDNITNDFQSSYVVESVQETIGEINIVTKYTLNSNDSVDDTIIINIGEICIKNDKEAASMMILSPLFRLVRLLHQRYHSGSLANINAILGCGVALPDIDTDIGISDCGIEDSKHVINSIFYSINWFRELISAFVTQKGQANVKKVLKRIDNVMELQEMLVSFMKQIPDHKLPSSHFYNVNVNSTFVAPQQEAPKSEATKAKRKKPNKSLNDTTRINSQGQSLTQKPKKSSKDKEIQGVNFREMDTDIILLLKLPLVEQQDDIPVLSLNQFKFIMSDLVMKLRTLFGTQQGVLSHLSHTVKPDELVKDLIRLMPYINAHLVYIVKGINECLEQCDGIHDAHEMFQPDATNLKTCLALVLETISLVLSWPGFQNGNNLPLLRDCLKPLVQTDDGPTQLCSAKQLAIAFVARLMNTIESCLTLQTAVALVSIVQALCLLPIDQTGIKKKLLLLSGKLLERKWFTSEGLPETGAVSSGRINTLIRAHLNGCNITVASSIISWVHSEVEYLKSKDDHLQTFPCITKSNFPILYRGICSALLEALTMELEGGRTNAQHLDIWRDTATTQHALTEIVKTVESSTNLNSYLRKTTGILKLFLSHGLPILEITFRSHSDRVFEIIKMIQQTTRFIHNLCCHTKVTKDRGLVGYVPQMRQVLETLVYRVKALLAANKCSSAFWMGNLKNKDIRGEEISSQSTTRSASGDEEELPPDSDRSDEEQNENTNRTNDDYDSDSEIF